MGRSDDRVERLQNFALSVGMLVGCLNSPDLREYLTARDVTEEEIEAAYKATITIAKAFYKDR